MEVEIILFGVLYFGVGLLVLLASGMPIGVAFAVLGGAYILIFRGTVGLGAVGNISWDYLTSELLITVPLFILMGEILFAGGLGANLFETASKWLGHLPGGLAVASVASCALFASVCGSSVATTATIGTVAYPEMTKRGYDTRLAAGILTTGGGIGILIPPSIPLIIYAFIAEQSVGKMFMAGVVPGLLFTVLPGLYVVLSVLLKPELAPRTEPTTWRDRFASLRYLWTIVVLVICVLGALYSGIVTASEAGAVGAIVSFLIVVLYKRTPLSLVWKAVMRTIRTSAFLALLLIGAHVMNHAIAWSGIPGVAMLFLIEQVPPWGIIPMMAGVYFILGMFMDTLAVMLLLMPILLPVMSQLGLDPVWFGVILVLNNEIALLTPPVGANMFVIQKVTGLPTMKVVRGVLPFVAVDVIGMILCAVFPILVLWLPNTMG